MLYASRHKTSFELSFSILTIKLSYENDISQTSAETDSAVGQMLAC